MTDFLSLFFLFCASSVFEVLLQVLVPICLVSCILSLVGVILHGKFV